MSTITAPRNSRADENVEETRCLPLNRPKLLTRSLAVRRSADEMLGDPRQHHVPLASARLSEGDAAVLRKTIPLDLYAMSDPGAF